MIRWLNGEFVHLWLTVYRFDIKQNLIYGIWIIFPLRYVCVDQKKKGPTTSTCIMPKFIICSIHQVNQASPKQPSFTKTNSLQLQTRTKENFKPITIRSCLVGLYGFDFLRKWEYKKEWERFWPPQCCTHNQLKGMYCFSI